MTTEQLVGTLEVLREQLATLANVELVGLIEAVKRDGHKGGDSSGASGDETTGARRSPAA